MVEVTDRFQAAQLLRYSSRYDTMIPPMLLQHSTRMHVTGRGTIHLAQSAHSPEQLSALHGSRHHLHFGIFNVLAIMWLLSSVQPGRCL